MYKIDQTKFDKQDSETSTKLLLIRLIINSDNLYIWKYNKHA